MDDLTARQAFELAQTLHREGANIIAAIKKLRERFGLDLLQAKGLVCMAYEGMSLEAYQARLAPALLQLCEEMEESDEAWGRSRMEQR